MAKPNRSMITCFISFNVEHACTVNDICLLFLIRGYGNMIIHKIIVKPMYLTISSGLLAEAA
jgi:hypothetical protein